MQRALALATLAATLFACTPAASSRTASSSASTPINTSPASTPSATPSADPAPEAVRLSHLPPQGIAVEGGREHSLVALVNLHGELLAKLQGFQLANPNTRPGVVLLQRRDQDYILRVETSTLEPISRSRARRLMQLGDRHVDLPGLQGTVDDAQSQDWRWMDLAPNGNVLLVQWFGYIGSECQVPIAHFVPVEEGAAVPITGLAAPGNVPASVSLGWTRNDRAVVLLREGYCGTPSVGAGVWGFSAPGQGERIAFARIEGAYQYRMWGPSSAPTQP